MDLQDYKYLLELGPEIKIRMPIRMAILMDKWLKEYNANPKVENEQYLLDL